MVRLLSGRKIASVQQLYRIRFMEEGRFGGMSPRLSTLLGVFSLRSGFGFRVYVCVSSRFRDPC